MFCFDMILVLVFDAWEKWGQREQQYLWSSEDRVTYLNSLFGSLEARRPDEKVSCRWRCRLQKDIFRIWRQKLFVGLMHSGPMKLKILFGRTVLATQLTFVVTVISMVNTFNVVSHIWPRLLRQCVTNLAEVFVFFMPLTPFLPTNSKSSFGSVRLPKRW